jgi:hypothetical protein
LQTGTKISGIAHLGLIAAALFGGAFRSDPLPFEVHEVSVISSEEYAALTAPRRPPEVSDELTSATEPEAAEPVTEMPEPIQPAEPDPAPERSAPDPVPEPAEPETSVITEPSPPPKIDRVAPEPVATPQEDARPDTTEQAEVTPEVGAETPQEAQEALAPEQAVDRIVPETSETAALAPTQSPRPPSARPTRPQQAAVAETTVESTEEPTPVSPTAKAVNAALAEVLAGPAPTEDAPVGPPLSSGERDALRLAVSQCWNVDVGGRSSQVTVTVAMSMEPSGKVVANSLRLIGSQGGNDQSVQTAFQAARRAILRCQRDGYELPAEKYAQWRDIEMTFNPERMRIK